MKQLTCEMCGSTDIMKQDGVFVCQVCGCKYSVEEARKMMIEGTVEVQGTVKVDNSAYVQKYLANARRAREKEDWEETEKYYNMVEQNAPDNIEAIFYSSYGKAKATLVDGDIYKRQAAFKVLKNCISVIDEHYKIEEAEENRKAIEDMAKDLVRMFLSNFVFTEWKNGYGVVTKTNKNETYELFAQLLMQFRESILNIAKVDDHAYLHESLKLTYGAILVLDGAWNQNFISRVQGWQKEADANIEKIRGKMIEAYWKEHADEKQQLESEKQELNEKIQWLQNQIENLPETKEILSLEKEITDINEKKSALGLFKVKEKKTLQEQIDRLEKQVTETKERKNIAAKPFVEKVGSIENRIKEIDAELTKDR